MQGRLFQGRPFRPRRPRTSRLPQIYAEVPRRPLTSARRHPHPVVPVSPGRPQLTGQTRPRTQAVQLVRPTSDAPRMLRQGQLTRRAPEPQALERQVLQRPPVQRLLKHRLLALRRCDGRRSRSRVLARLSHRQTPAQLVPRRRSSRRRVVPTFVGCPVTRSESVICVLRQSSGVGSPVACRWV